MALTLIAAASGRGVILRDTQARREVFIAENELLTIGSALIQLATENEPLPRQRREPRR